MISRPTQEDINIINQFKSDLNNREYLKFYELGYLSNCELYENEWCDIQRVSKDSEGNLLGFIFMGINRAHDRIDNVQLVNISKQPSLTFSKDIIKVFEEIKNKYRKICFEVVVGNPAEKIYDRIVKKYKGRIVGINKDHIRLTDEKFYDFKSYEIIFKDIK